MPKEELESLKPIFSENPWVKNDHKRNQVIFQANCAEEMHTQNLFYRQVSLTFKIIDKGAKFLSQTQLF